MLNSLKPDRDNITTYLGFILKVPAFFERIDHLLYLKSVVLEKN